MIKVASSKCYEKVRKVNLNLGLRERLLSLLWKVAILDLAFLIYVSTLLKQEKTREKNKRSRLT